MDVHKDTKKSSSKESRRKRKSKRLCEQRVRWAHEAIVEETGGKDTRFTKLTLRQYIAVELEVEMTWKEDKREVEELRRFIQTVISMIDNFKPFVVWKQD